MKRLPTILAAALLALAAGVAHIEAAEAPKPPADTSRVTLGTGASATEAFVAWPTGSGHASGIVIVHEEWGLNFGIRDMARRFARQGYVTIVPDLYHGKTATDAESAQELSRTLDPRQAAADLGASLDWLRGQKRTAKARFGVIGFGMGGGLAESFATGRPGLSAAVMFYGAPDPDPARLAALSAPLQGHFGEKDDGIAVERVNEFDAALSRAGKAHEIFVYAGAGHAFMSEGLPSYHGDAARQAWARMLSFLQKNLKARP